MCSISQFYKTKLEEFIKVCYKDINRSESEFPTFKQVNNPIINKEEPCFLLNNKKQEYYKHTYNPTKIIENVSNYTINENFKIDKQFRKEYLENMIKIIDMTPRDKCCNCISFTLYSTAFSKEIEDEDDEADTDEDDEDTFYDVLTKLCGYLLCLNISIINIKNRLEDFVARIYLDISVISVINELNELKIKYVKDKKKIEELEKYKKDILEYIQFLFRADNVEIYTYLCESYIENIETTRSLRFLPMIDPEVNVSIVREADGIVSYTDIYNIKNFITSNKMIFMYPWQPLNFIDTSITEMLYIFTETGKFPTYLSHEIDYVNLPYKDWLKIYIINNKYFTDKGPLFDLLAGLFGIAIKIRPEIFMESLHNVNINISKKSQHIRDKYKETIKIGFDEIFLMELFKDLYTYNIKHKLNEYDPTAIANIMFILNNFQYPLKTNNINIETIIPIKCISDTLFEMDDIDNRKIYKKIESIRNGINMYIMDYNIDYIIQTKQIKESCIDIKVNDMNIMNILNNILTRYIFQSGFFNSIFHEYGQNFHTDKIIFKLYNGGYKKFNLKEYKQKYEKYKNKYLQLKNKILN